MAKAKQRKVQENSVKAEHHDYQLDLALNDIEHTKTNVKSLQTHGICERFHQTRFQAFFQIAIRQKIYTDLETLIIKLSCLCSLDNTYPIHSFLIDKYR